MYTPQDYILFLSVLILLLGCLAVLGLALEGREPSLGLLRTAQAKWAQWSGEREKRLNAKVLRWVNKDAQARADRRGRA